MANASAKRVAAQNEAALRNLSYLMVLMPLIAFTIRFFFRGSVIPSRTSTVIHILTLIPSLVLYRQLNSIGSPRRDAMTGALISAGEDLNMPGVIEWSWDVIYVTWFCQAGTAVLGEWFWWFYLSIPTYAVYRLYTTFVGPIFSSKSSGAAEPETADKEANGVSKRQQKLQKRSEKGDPRVRAVQR